MENTADSGGANTGFRCASDLATPKAQKRVKKKVEKKKSKKKKATARVEL